MKKEECVNSKQGAKEQEQVQRDVCQSDVPKDEGCYAFPAFKELRCVGAASMPTLIGAAN